MKYLRYLRYLIVHTHRVRMKCWRLGLYHAMFHDLDKFLPWNFIRHARGEYNFHRERRKHHWEYWQGEEMPVKYVEEMLVDWIVSAEMQGNDLKSWYNKKMDINLHPNTKQVIELTI